MLVQTPPMGFNTWNTFGADISEELITQTCDAMVEKGYRDAGYSYIVIDDCWMLAERDGDGRLVADPVKFPHGMKYLADYIHARGMKFGIYSCAGLRTCQDLPSSFGHEFEDARTFAEWGVDFLKYDFCNFPERADCTLAYHTMSMALKASGRDILFSACQWGHFEPWKWMRSIGVHMYRSTGDINDSYVSIRDIAESQFQNLKFNASGCFNDPDMLVVGMYGKGNVGMGSAPTDEEYRTHFALWCLMGVPLIIGGDVRKIDGFCRDLLLNRELIAIDQDPDCREPFLVGNRGGHRPVFLRHMADGTFVIGMFNLTDNRSRMPFLFPDAGLPWHSGVGLELTDVFTGENLGIRRDDFSPVLEPHTCKLYRARLVTL
ncbi:MAG: glycoside hydrolase family 27 protein [Clostridia bacterium]|nr:glycoside hydrolase family 27 protein [Clostridia bacterium]